MAFEYRLEQLMKLNESEKQQLEREYQVLYERLEEIAQKLVELLKKKERLQNELNEQSQSKVTAFSIHERLNYIGMIEKAIEWEQQNYLGLKVRVERFRDSLVEKSIEVKKHERLKEQAYHNYLTLEKKTEMKKMDENAQLVRTFRESARRS